jgi:hypothetical protein
MLVRLFVLARLGTQMAWVLDLRKKNRKTTRSGSDLGDMAAFKPPQRRPPRALIQHGRPTSRQLPRLLGARVATFIELSWVLKPIFGSNGIFGGYQARGAQQDYFFRGLPPPKIATPGAVASQWTKTPKSRPY